MESKGEKSKEISRESQNMRGEEQKRKYRKEREKIKERRKERKEERKERGRRIREEEGSELASYSGQTQKGLERNCAMRGRCLPTLVLFYA